MDRFNFKLIFFSALIIGLLIFGVRYAVKYERYYNIEQLDESVLDDMDLKKYDNLMIVAHPDDETIWGGAHLAEDNYLVVCITNGKYDERKEEYINAVSVSGDKALILDYPDKAFGKRDDWTKVSEGITVDLRNIIDYKDWNIIVTHNPDGEYGHRHHILLNNYVSEICQSYSLDNLYYFGHYYTRKKLADVEENLTQLEDENLLEIKNKMISKYITQEEVLLNLGHMIPYENWVKASEWE